MGVIIIVIPLALLSAILYLIFSAKVAGWIIWVALAYFALGFLYKAIVARKSFRKGEYLREGEIVAMLSQPYVSIIIIAIIIAFIFVDYSKLHLLWIYIVISAVFDYVFARKVVSMDNQGDNSK